MSAHTRPLPSFTWHGTRVGIPGLRRLWRALVTRPALAELDARLLRDIGVTPAQARTELHRGIGSILRD